MTRALLILILATAPALAAAPASSSAASSSPAAAPLLSKHDPNAPINISADKFMADSNAKTGTWTGNVVVIQSDMRMRANSVRLNVTGKDDKPDKIFASGNVVVDSPNSGTVTGDNGVYDVVGHTVTMTGKVVLTKDKDVMRGTQLTVNLDTGKATLGAGKAPGGPNTTESSAQTGGRVQGIFTPPPSSNPEKNGATKPN
ncbi:MAG TPA: LptA/OstA family protein [Rhizomicrobium sp.]|nr:LptA/OstA family protein [Rhizomicrobium sp.]